MKHTLRFAALSAVALALGGCAVQAPPADGGGSAAATGSVAAMEEACRNALVDFHGTRDIVVLGSEPYQGGGRFVRAGVGQTREVWQCIALADGSTVDIQYLSDGTGGGMPPSGGQGRPAVGSEYDLTPFEGARAGQAEGGIRALGYEAVRSRGLTTWWFNRSTGACAQITTSNGRYSSVNMLPAEDC